MYFKKDPISKFFTLMKVNALPSLTSRLQIPGAKTQLNMN